jgi:hypothetical protein
MHGIIYKATGPDGRVYVGQTKKTLAQRKADHAFRARVNDQRTAFQVAILELGGVNAFTWEQIDTFNGKEELEQKEKYWTAYYKADDPAYGYSGQSGGIHFTASTETRKKMSDALKHHPVTEETRRKISEGNKGKPKSPEHCRNSSEGHKGIRHTEEAKRKISESTRGEKGNFNKLTEAQAREIKIALNNGETCAVLGKKYGVGRTAISNIKFGRTWAWLIV